jgi:hypothetical protein
MQLDEPIVLRRRSQWKILSPISLSIILIIIVVLGAAVSGLWFFAAHETEALLDAWITREKSVDRIWTCPDRQIAGYPFKIEISCTKPAFAGEVFGKQVVGNLQGVHIDASLFHPDRADALPQAPFELHSVDGDGEMTLQWDHLRVRLDGLPQDLAAGSIDGSNVSLRGGLKGLGALAGRAETVSSVIAVMPERLAENAYSFQIVLDKASIPILDSFFGSAAPDAIKLDGIITKADFRAPGTLMQRADHWRLAGGSLELNEAAVTHGITKIAARGTLQLDDQHRPQGKLDAEFAGAEPLLRRFGVNPSLLGAGSLLSALFGGRQNGNAASTDGPPALHLPVVLQAGFISIGPVKTSLPVPPLY